jgi:hypothetical protein
MAEPGKTNGGGDRDGRERRLRQRNLAMLAVLGGLAVLFYVITIVKMGGGN